MRRQAFALAAALAALCLWAPTAQAAFGFEGLDTAYSGPGGIVSLRAGSHPYAMTTTVEFNAIGEALEGGQVRDLYVDLPPGLAGDPYAVSRCAAADFLPLIPLCPDASAVGVVSVRKAGEAEFSDSAAVYNLIPPPGVVAMIGFHVLGVTVDVPLGLRPGGQRNVFAHLEGIPQAEAVAGSRLTVWGVPADPAHDPQRGSCLADGGSCPGPEEEHPFLTLPTSCEGPLRTLFAADSWTLPGARLASGEPDLTDAAWAQGEAQSHDDSQPPLPLGTYGCSKLGFAPEISAEPTSKATTSPSGLDFSLDVKDEGLTNPSYEAVADSDIEKAVVTLPKGMSANPSLAEGLEVCTMEELDRETAFSEPGEGCPDASKIGSVEVETPLLEGKLLKGSLYVAKPYENYAGDSLIALYLVIQNRELGISVKQPLKVEPDPVTGQLTTVAEELPQLPFSHFRLHFREGGRSPLVTPQACGSYDVKALLYPYSGNPPIASTSAFQIITGPNEGPCPSGGLLPFRPGLIAGTANNRAGSFSPFYLRLSRTDSEQEITHFSIKLPPGIVGKLAGIPYCSDAAIEAAKGRTGPHGGQEELEDPSCPAASEIGRTLAGAGVGPELTYAPGKVYLAGSYHGSNLSMVAITSGVVGPFDIGTVVVREGFKIDPETAEVFIDSTGSDPIPHIVRGIPVHLRDIRAYVDRPEFVLNPTDCTRTSTASTVLGSGLDFVSEADDNPITVTSPFQAADCAALPFQPQLGLRLIGGTRRGAHPAFRAHLQMNGIGEAGIAYSQVTLPRSEFIENAHFRTICTRVQFKAGAGNGSQCPPDSIYGKARALTPILGEPLEGPVFLRSSEHQLPDLVVALHNSQVDFDLVGRVDSVKGGGLRNTFEAAPDAPVSSFDLMMEGGKKGLFVNSTDLCARTHRAKSLFVGQNGKVSKAKPALRVKCRGRHRHRRRDGR